jgi:hypothetical protein
MALASRRVTGEFCALVPELVCCRARWPTLQAQLVDLRLRNDLLVLLPGLGQRRQRVEPPRGEILKRLALVSDEGSFVLRCVSDLAELLSQSSDGSLAARF